MGYIKTKLNEIFQEILSNHFQMEIQDLEWQNTRKDFEGDYTLVVFPLIRFLKMKPEEAANQLGKKALTYPEIKSFNVVKGFLNLSLNDNLWTSALLQHEEKPTPKHGMMVEYSSPNTNKPLHLGHVRTILLGYSIAQILEAAGHPAHKTQIINDRGIHICKSMYAYQQSGEGKTPQSEGVKGDKFIGDYYIHFEKEYRKEIKELEEKGWSEKEAKSQAPSMMAAREMLKKWENQDPEIIQLWKTMNQWVYDGFDVTYKRLGVSFDSVDYESETYLIGKELVNQGLEKGVCYQKEDGSIWVDLSNEGLDEKLLLRADGTAVYITQDLGTAVERFEKNPIEGLIYVVGNEQDYHFKVLFLILKKLGYQWAENLYHLSYGMVDLPEGKMKSREGKVVDADDLMEEMHQTAKSMALELGKLDDFSDEEKEEIYEKIGLAALKYFILKVDPKKRILFDPKKSVDFTGNTGPFLLYAYARIQSMLRKEDPQITDFETLEISESEKNIVQLIDQYGEHIQKAADELNPATITNYLYDLVREYNHFYQNHSVLNADTEQLKQFRLHLSARTAQTLKSGLALLGIDTVQKM